MAKDILDQYEPYEEADILDRYEPFKQNKDQQMAEAIQKTKPQSQELGIGQKYIAPALAGAAEGAQGALASIFNVPHALGLNTPHIGQIDLSQYLQPGYEPLARSGGQLAGEVLAPLGVAGKVAGKIPKAAGKLGLLQEALQGAAGGYAAGEYMPGGRGLSAALGGLGAPLAGATDKALASKILNKESSLKKSFNELYGDIFKTAAKHEHKIGKTAVPDLRYNKLEESIGRYVPTKAEKSSPTLLDFKKNPTVEGAHKAKSELSSVARKLEKSLTVNPDPKKERFLKEVKYAGEKLQDYVHTNLKKISPELQKDYVKAQEKYLTEMVPYKKSSVGIKKYKAGEISPEKFIRDIANSESNYAFRQTAGKEFPELSLNQFLGKAKEKVPYALGAGAGAFGARELLSRLLGGEK